jgi:hypothetical protein
VYVFLNSLQCTKDISPCGFGFALFVVSTCDNLFRLLKGLVDVVVLPGLGVLGFLEQSFHLFGKGRWQVRHGGRGGNYSPIRVEPFVAYLYFFFSGRIDAKSLLDVGRGGDRRLAPSLSRPSRVRPGATRSDGGIVRIVLSLRN